MGIGLACINYARFGGCQLRVDSYQLSHTHISQNGTRKCKLEDQEAVAKAVK